MVVPLVDRISSSDGGQLAKLDAELAFDACAANTRFTNTVYVQRNDKFCYTGHVYVAGVNVSNKVIDVSGDYVTMDITVWKGP